MIFTIAIISLAFYWLLYETYWLTIRLPRSLKKLFTPKTLEEVLPIVFAAAIIMAVLKSLIPKGTKKKQEKKAEWHHIFRILLPPKPIG